MSIVCKENNCTNILNVKYYALQKNGGMVVAENIMGGVLSVCVFSVIGSVSLWLNGSDKMKKTLKLCLSVLTLSLIFSFVEKIEDVEDFNLNFDSNPVISDEEIAESAGEAVISICKSVLNGICEDETNIYYDENVLIVEVSQKDNDKTEQIEQVLSNIVLSEVRVFKE